MLYFCLLFAVLCFAFEEDTGLSSIDGWSSEHSLDFIRSLHLPKYAATRTLPKAVDHGVFRKHDVVSRQLGRIHELERSIKLAKQDIKMRKVKAKRDQSEIVSAEKKLLRKEKSLEMLKVQLKKNLREKLLKTLQIQMKASKEILDNVDGDSETVIEFTEKVDELQDQIKSLEAQLGEFDDDDSSSVEEKKIVDEEEVSEEEIETTEEKVDTEETQMTIEESQAKLDEDEQLIEAEISQVKSELEETDSFLGSVSE